VSPGHLNHWQELQVLLVQDVQPDVPARGFSVPVAAKTENFFFISSESHFGQLTF
jgi:hypothetical protein